MAKAIKVDSTRGKELNTLINTFGVEVDKMYLIEKKAYMLVDNVLKVLAVELNWFLKNSESKIHYYVIKKQYYVNIFGLFKIICQSRQPIAYKLQEYLFELFVEVELHGKINVEDLVVRKELLELLDEKQTTLDQLETEKEAVDMDVALLTNKLDNANKLIEKQQDEIEELQDEIESYKVIAVNLSKHVKLNTKLMIDLPVEVEDLSDSDKQKVAKEAYMSKAKLKELCKKKKAIKPTEITYNIDNTKELCYLLCTTFIIEHVGGIPCYDWKITTESYSTEYIELCKEFIELRDKSTKCVAHLFKDRFVIYSAIHLSSLEKKILTKVLKLNYYSVSQVLSLIYS